MDTCAIVALYRESGEIDLRADIPRITQPALILPGRLDAIQPLAESERLATSSRPPVAFLDTFNDSLQF